MSLQNFNELKQKALKKYFKKMNPEQQEAIFTINGPVLILAGAGSGKTTVIVNRIANMINFGDSYFTNFEQNNSESIDFLNNYINNTEDEVDLEKLKNYLSLSPINPWNILAITFTNKAASELKTRLSSMLGDKADDINAATFHSSCVRILRREIEVMGYNSNFTIYDTDDSQRLIKACLNELNISEKQLTPKTVMFEISSAKNQLLNPEELKAEANGDYKKTAVAQVYKEYQKRLMSANALDFDDIIKLTVELFMENEDVLIKYQNRFKYIMVDEYQDTNYSQFKLVSLLSQSHKNLCVVGDDDQSIYKFRGATIENILNFESQFENCKTIKLEQNYRSTKNILNAANSVIVNNNNRKDKSLWSDQNDGDKICIFKAIDENDEAKFVANKIIENVKAGSKFKDNLVLYRMNAQSNIVERALIQSGIPYRVYGGMKFYDRKEIKDIISYLSVINNGNDILRFKRIVNEPKRGIGDTTIEMLEDICRDLSASPIEIMRNAQIYPLLSKKANTLKSIAKMFDYLKEQSEKMPLDMFLDLLIDKTGYKEYLLSQGDEGANRLDNVNELKTNIIEYIESDDKSSLNGFLEEVSLYTDIDRYDSNTDNVVLMTIHSSKGLEFENVFVVGMEDGIFPSNRSIYSEDDLEEERRLAYVAFTRAKKKLNLIHASQRMLFGTTNRNMKSRFIKEIDSSLIEKKENKKSTVNQVSPKTEMVKSISLEEQLAKNKMQSNLGKLKNVNFSIGDRVLHSVFGEGTVLSVTALANDSMLEVGFDKVGTKKLMAKYAKITLV